MSIRTYRRTPGEMQDRRIQNATPADTHSEVRPHFDRAGNCLCVKLCCLGPGGCKCRGGCTHRSHPRVRSQENG